MSDWRGDNSSGKPSKPSRREPKQPKEKKSRPVKPATGGWRGKGSKGVVPAGSPEAEKSWQGGYAETAPVTASAVGRWTALMFLSVVAIVLTGVFIWWVFLSKDQLPLYLVSVGNCDSPELVENPFGNDERETLPSVNKGNIKYVLDADRVNDNLLSKFQFENWLPNDKKSIDGGGPSGEFVVFYINSFVVEKDGVLNLVPRSGQPWLVDSVAGTETVEMKVMLQNIARSLANRTVGWVVLDLHSPPDGLTQNGVDNHWESLTQAAWESLDEKDRNRLVITLPCKDGEENWLAPEYKSTFFGYFFKRALAGGLSEKDKWIETTTLSAMQEILNPRITSAVANRRYAKQTPVWIIPDSVSQSKKVVSRTNSNDFQAIAPSGLKQRLDEMAVLWNELEQNHKEAWRWDPTGTAVAESSLIFAEQLSTWGSPERFLLAKNSAEEAIKRIQVPLKPPSVSLVEDELYQKLVKGDSKKYDTLDRLASSPSMPSFWDEPKPADGSLPPQSPDLEVQTSDRASYYWKWLVHRARLGDRNERTRTFEKLRTARGLEYCKDGKGWLEIYFVGLILKEVDWDPGLDGESRDRENAVALSVSVFDRLQTIAGNPVSELSWWIEGPVKKLEGQFLMAFDKLLAGSFAESAAELGRIDSEIQELVTRITPLQEALETRDRATRVIPDLIAWHLRHFRYCDDSLVDEKLDGSLQKRLKLLAGMMDTIGKLSNELAGEPNLESLKLNLESWGRLKESLQSELAYFQKFVDEQKDPDKNPKNNPKTYRNIWLVLQSPLTKGDDRKLLHAIVAEYLEKGTVLTEPGALAGTISPPHRNLNVVSGLSNTDPQSAGKGEFWKEIVSGSMRFSIAETVKKDIVGANPPAGQVIQDWRTQLLQKDIAFRFRIGPFADAATFRKQPEVLKDWPWSIGSQRWKLDTANYRLFQTRRLAQAAWGSLDNGDLDSVTKKEDCFFAQLAGKYRPEDAIKPRNDLLQKDMAVGALANEFSGLWEESVSPVVGKLMALEVNVQTDQETFNSDVTAKETTIEVLPKSWNAIPEVRLVHQDRNLPLVMPLKGLNRESKYLLPVDLSGGQNTIEGIGIDVKPWKESDGSKPERRVSLRGNWRTAKVNWTFSQTRRTEYELQFQAEPVVETVIEVKRVNPPVVNVMLLIDCSGSMDLMVDPLQEGGGGGPQPKVKLFTQVQARAKSIVERLAEIHKRRDAVVNLGLMSFGLRQPQEGGILSEKMAEQIFRTELNTLEPGWAEKVSVAIGQLAYDEETPLYDAILRACSVLENLQGRRQLIYVLSDGVNYTTPVEINPNTKVKKGTGLNGIASDVEKKLDSMKNVKLNIFHIDHFHEWIENEWKPRWWRENESVPGYSIEEKNKIIGEEEKRWEKLQEDGIDALNRMNQLDNLKSKFSYRNYTGNQYTEMSQDVEDSIPQMKIVLTATGDLPNYPPGTTRFVIPAESLPCDVTVTAEFDSLDKAVQTVRVLGGEYLSLSYQPGLEYLRLPDFKNENDGFFEADKSDTDRIRKLYIEEIKDNEGKRVYSFGFGNAPSNQKVFVNRPGFLVAEVNELVSGPNGKRFFLADHAFLTGKHFPIAKTSKLEIPHTTGTSLRVWYADVVPECVQHVPLDDGVNDQQIEAAVATALEKLGVKNADVEISRDAPNPKMVNCKVKYTGEVVPNQRLFVLCMGATESARTFDLAKPNNNWESHVFTLDGTGETKKPVIQLVTPGKLNESLDGNLRRVEK